MQRWSRGQPVSLPALTKHTITAKVEPLRCAADCTACYHGAARHGTALGHSQQTESSAVSLRLQCCKICNVAF